MWIYLINVTNTKLFFTIATINFFSLIKYNKLAHLVMSTLKIKTLYKHLNFLYTWCELIEKLTQFFNRKMLKFIRALVILDIHMHVKFTN